MSKPPSPRKKMSMPTPWVICWDQYAGEEIIRTVRITIMTEETLRAQIERYKHDKKRIAAAYRLGENIYREDITKEDMSEIS